jgi:hypothetical protein
MMSSIHGPAILLGLVVVATATLAHVPEHPSDDRAIRVEDPSVSRVFYLELVPGETRVFSFDVDEGQAIELALNQPAGHEAVSPRLVLVGPGLPNGTPPEGVDVGQGEGLLEAQQQPEASPSYEPFAPSANRPVANLEIEANASGSHRAVVVAEDPSSASFVIGTREAFSATEWMTNPVGVLEAYHWSGQPWPLVLAPAALTALAGAGLALDGLGLPRPGSPRAGLVLAGGVLAAATTSTVLVQTVLATRYTGLTAGHIVTALVAGLPLVVGGAHLRVAGGGVGTSWRSRVGLVGLAALGLATWSGYLVGPALALLAAVWPEHGSA